MQRLHDGHPPMQLDGDVIQYLNGAILSARRLRGHPVHVDTLRFWQDLLSHARQERRRTGNGGPSIDALIEALENELAERG